MWSDVATVALPSVTYALGAGLAIGSLAMANFFLAQYFESEPLQALLLRRHGPRKLLRDWGGLKRSRASIRQLGSLPIYVLLGSGLYFLAFSIFVGIAFSNHLPAVVSITASAAGGLATGFTAAVYIGSGGRWGHGRLAPRVDCHPYTMGSAARVTTAASLLLITLSDIVLVFIPIAVCSGAYIGLTETHEAAKDKHSAVLYFAGVPLMIVVAWLTRRYVITLVSPRLVTARLIFETRDPRLGVTDAVSVRSSLRSLCRLVGRCAARESRKESVINVQNPRAVVLRAVAGNLRSYLSNRASHTTRMVDVTSDLNMVAAFLCDPMSDRAFDRLAARMNAFESNGSPRQEFQGEHRSRAASILNRFFVGLERTHQGITRTAVIAGIFVIGALLISGTLKLSEFVKLVKF